MKPLPVISAVVLMAGCAAWRPDSKSQVGEFLTMYNDVEQKLSTVAAQAAWKAATDVSEQHTGERIGAEATHAAFQGNRYVIESARRFLAQKESLSDLEFRQLDKILLDAAEYPGTLPDLVKAREWKPRLRPAPCWTVSPFVWSGRANAA